MDSVDVQMNAKITYTHATPKRLAIYHVAIELTDCHRSIFVTVHSNKGKATVGLEARFNDVSEILK